MTGLITWWAALPASMATARADEIAYLVNVAMRPGYGFANADEALRYGHNICQNIADRDPFDAIVDQVQSDLATSDDYQATYLIGQAANELCPALIWTLRHSATNHQAILKTIPAPTDPSTAPPERSDS